jgi:hypothetical protein
LEILVSDIQIDQSFHSVRNVFWLYEHSEKLCRHINNTGMERVNEGALGLKDLHKALELA